MTDREKLIELLLSGDKTVQCEHSPEVNCDGMKCAFCERMEIANYLIAHGVTFAKGTDVPSKWISVEERLPEKDGTYIVRSDVGSVYTSRFYAERHYLNGYTKPANWTKRGKVEVTHWMPLPSTEWIK